MQSEPRHTPSLVGARRCVTGLIMAEDNGDRVVITCCDGSRRVGRLGGVGLDVAVVLAPEKEQVVALRHIVSLETVSMTERPMVATVLSARPWEARLVAMARAAGSIRVVGRLYQPEDFERLRQVDVLVVGAETSLGDTG